MASNKLSFLNSLTERKKPNNKDGNNNEELAIVKAAAWAWYQHGSTHELGEGTSEFDVTRTRRVPRPSRYKLEAMRSTKEVKEGSPIDNKASLLDAYEVQSISRHLDRLLESNNNHNKLVNGTDNNVANASVDVGGGRTKKKKKKIRKGFFLRHGAICGREEDVVDPTSASRDHRVANPQRVSSVCQYPTPTVPCDIFPLLG